MDKDIRPRKAMGGSGVESVKSSGSAGINYLFYFLPDTNGRAYIVMVRHKNYMLYTDCSVRIMNVETGYNKVQYNENPMDSYLHRFEFDGLETDVTYTIRMSWINESGAEWVDIERTYYCNNDTPSCYPYSDAFGKTTIQQYDSDFPEFCLQVECETDRQDGRCPYDEETRNLFWRVCATNYETHPIASAMEPQVTARWPAGTVYVDVNYINDVEDDYKENCNEISKRIREWIVWMNTLTEPYGVHFELGSTTKKNGKQITVYVGTHQQLWGYNPDESQDETYVYGGMWESNSSGDGIVEARVKICCESRYPWNYCDSPFEGIVFEELTEASGPRYDQFGINNTVFSEFSYPGKTIGGPPGESWERDENVIRILYSLGYLYGYETDVEDSEFGTDIKFDKLYSSFGHLSSSNPDLFFQINVTKGSVTSYDTPQTTLPLTYKNKRLYTIRALYATRIPLTREEETAGQSNFYYTNPSESSEPYFDLPNRPRLISSTKVDKGYIFNVDGLSVAGEKYYVVAYLKDVCDSDIEDETYFAQGEAGYNDSVVAVEDVKYGRAYDFYLFSYYQKRNAANAGSAESDWIYIGEGKIAPMKPIVDDLRNTDTEVSFSYDMDGTVFDEVRYKLYKDGVMVQGGSSVMDSDEVTIEFEKITGRYELKIYSVVSTNGIDVQCVDSEGELSYVTYGFVISDRTKFYWSDAVEKGKPVSDVSHIEWRNFVTNIRDTVCIYKGINGTIPSNASIYASGFGLAAGESFENALMLYAIMPEDGNRELSAERFNIVNYIINYCKTTNISYKYKKTVQQCEVIADELFQLQNTLNSL